MFPARSGARQGVDRNDVNPRPLSEIVPRHGIIGCFSADEKSLFATAFEPYQELFQGVITCLHSDFRIGGLQPGETKSIRGKVYGAVFHDILQFFARVLANLADQGCGLPRGRLLRVPGAP